MDSQLLLTYSYRIESCLTVVVIPPVAERVPGGHIGVISPGGEDVAPGVIGVGRCLAALAVQHRHNVALLVLHIGVLAVGLAEIPFETENIPVLVIAAVRPKPSYVKCFFRLTVLWLRSFS